MAKGRSAGLIVLAIYLIVVGLVQVISLSFEGLPFVLGGLAIIAGLLLLLGK